MTFFVIYCNLYFSRLGTYAVVQISVHYNQKIVKACANKLNIYIYSTHLTRGIPFNILENR